MAAMAQAEVPTPPQPASPTKQEIWRVSLTVSHQTWTCATSLNSVKHISVKVAPQTEYIYIYTYMWLCVNTYCSGLSFLCIVSEFGFIYGSPSKLNIFVYMFTLDLDFPEGDQDAMSMNCGASNRPNAQFVHRLDQALSTPTTATLRGAKAKAASAAERWRGIWWQMFFLKAKVWRWSSRPPEPM